MSAAQGDAGRVQARGSMVPVLPLALLESIRAHDRPREVLEDENLAASLPRRLGLTGVVESRIQAYEHASRHGRTVPVEEVADLLRLVLRRPDAEAILRDAGSRVARRHFRRGSSGGVMLRVLPRGMLHRAAGRAARRMLRRIAGRSRIEVATRPFNVRITAPLTATLDETGVACTLYTGALEELVFLYTRDRPSVAHPRCAARGERCCEWVLAE